MRCFCFLFQISHGFVSHEALSSFFDDRTDPLAKDVLSNLTAYRVDAELREKKEDRWKDKVWIDNAQTSGDTIALHYSHSYTCNETDYNIQFRRCQLTTRSDVLSRIVPRGSTKTCNSKASSLNPNLFQESPAL